MKRRHACALLASAATVLTTSLACAQSSAVDEVASTERPQPMPMLAPTGMRQAIRDIPATVVILPGDLLSDYGVLTISEALRLVGGVTPTTLGWSGYDLRLRGKTSTGPERLIVMIDGVEVDALFERFTDLATLPVDIDDVERIELSSGPSTAGYGHALAAGVVNIVTKHPADVERAYVHLRASDADGQIAFGRVGANFGPTAVRLALTHRRREATSDDSSALLDSSDITLDRATLRSSTQVGDKGTLQVDASWLFAQGSSVTVPTRSGEEHNGYTRAVWTSQPSASDELTLRFDRWIDDQALSAGDCGAASVAGMRLASGANRLGAAGSEPRSDDAVETAPDPAATPASCEFARKEQRTVATVQDVHLVGDALRFVVGAGTRTERTSAPASGDASPSWAASYLRAYGGVEWRATPALTLNLGASSDNASAANRDSSVRGGVNWHVSGEQTLRAAVTSGRWASDRLAVLGVPGLNVDSERTTTSDVGYLLELPTHDASVSARMFWQRLQGMVGNPAAGRGEQAAFGDIRGIEGRASMALATCCSGYATLAYAEEGRSSGTAQARRDWISQAALGASANWGGGWRTSAAWAGSASDGASGIASSRLGVSLIKDFTALGSRIRLTLSARHSQGAAQTDEAFASVQVAY